MSIIKRIPLLIAGGIGYVLGTKAGRELQSGIEAEETIQLPPRDTRNIEKAEAKERDDIRRGRELRRGSRHRRD